MFKVSRIFLLLVLSSTVSSQKMFRNGSEIDCQRIPFAFRCTNGELVERCSFNAFCEDYRNLTSGTKIRLTVLFASFCFYSQKFIIETLYPKVYQNFKDYVDIELVPFGNANRTEVSFLFKLCLILHVQDGKINCKLGEEECQAHLTITCAQKYLKDAIPFVYCLEKSFKRQRSNNGTVEKCYGQTEIVEETQAKLEWVMWCRVRIRVLRKLL